MHILLIRNDRSGTATRRAQFHNVVARLKDIGSKIEVLTPNSSSQTKTIATTVERSAYDVVIVAGGDGTVSSVVNGLVTIPKHLRPPLAILPTGRGNDFAHALGLLSGEDTLSAIIDDSRCNVDLGKTQSGVFLGVAGTGFDAKAARRAQTTPLLTGRTLYTYAAIRTLLEFDNINAKIRFEGGSYQGTITLAAVGNNQRYGGGMYITPFAKLSDGLLDLCLVKDISRVDFLKMLPKVFTGKHLCHASVSYHQTPFVEISTAEPTEVFADGEFLQKTPITIRLLPQELEVFTQLNKGFQKH